MKVQVKYFAIYRDLKGKEEEWVEVPCTFTIKDLFFMLMGGESLRAQYFAVTQFAVNRHYVSKTSPLQENCEVAFIPPIAGG